MVPNNSHVSRRKVLQSTGVSAAALSTLPTASADDTVKLPFLKQGDTVKRWLEAPRSWHEHNEHAKRVLERNGRVDDDNVVGCGLGSTSEKMFGGWKGRVIHYDVLDDSKFNGPDEIEGVPVTVSETGPAKELCGCYNNKPYDPIPGGASWSRQGSGLEYDGTACARAHKNGEDYILTANHVMNDSKCTETIGETADQCGNDVGDVMISNREEDWALVNDRITQASSEIDDTYYLRTLKGHVTQTGLYNLKNAGIDICKAGASSGRTCSDIRYTNYQYTEDCRDFKNNGMSTYVDATHRDSGAPFYWLDENYDAWLCGLLTYAHENDKAGYSECGMDMHDSTFGISAEHLYYDHGISFGEGGRTDAEGV
ncbi:MAG: hypothetical protein ABEJ42_06590 [Halobacteriaceae archaeon]